jgi:predicted Zn-dependent protease
LEPVKRGEEQKMKQEIKITYCIYALTWLAMVIFLSSCAVTQPIEADREMGMQVSEQVAAEMGIFKDEARTEYLNAIGQRLVRTLGDQRFAYSFQIVDQPESNAFAAPGGYIFVSRGFLAITNRRRAY